MSRLAGGRAPRICCRNRRALSGPRQPATENSVSAIRRRSGSSSPLAAGFPASAECAVRGSGVWDRVENTDPRYVKRRFERPDLRCKGRRMEISSVGDMPDDTCLLCFHSAGYVNRIASDNPISWILQIENFYRCSASVRRRGNHSSGTGPCLSASSTMMRRSQLLSFERWAAAVQYMCRRTFTSKGNRANARRPS